MIQDDTNMIITHIDRDIIYWSHLFINKKHKNISSCNRTKPHASKHWEPGVCTKKERCLPRFCEPESAEVCQRKWDNGNDPSRGFTCLLKVWRFQWITSWQNNVEISWYYVLQYWLGKRIHFQMSEPCIFHFKYLICGRSGYNSGSRAVANMLCLFSLAKGVASTRVPTVTAVKKVTTKNTHPN